MSMMREEAVEILEDSKRQNEVMRDNPSTFWASYQMADGIKNAEKRIAALALNQGFGFGTDRLQKFIVAAGEHAGNQDEILWWHLDQLLIDKLGLPFEREKEG